MKGCNSNEFITFEIFFKNFRKKSFENLHLKTHALTSFDVLKRLKASFEVLDTI